MQHKLDFSAYYSQLSKKGVLNKYVVIGKTAYGHDRIVCVSSSVLVGTKFFELKEDVKKGMLRSVSYIFSEVEHDKVVEADNGANKDFIEPLDDLQSILDKLIQVEPSEAIKSDNNGYYGSKSKVKKEDTDTQLEKSTPIIREYDKDDVLALSETIKTEIMSQTIDEVQGIYPHYDVAKLVVEGKANADIISLVKSTYQFKCSFIASVANVLNKKHLQ